MTEPQPERLLPALPDSEPRSPARSPQYETNLVAVRELRRRMGWIRDAEDDEESAES